MNALDRLRRRAADLLAGTPRRLPTLRHRRPRVRVVTAPAVPAWLLRLVCAGLGVGCVRLAGAGDTLTVLGAVLAALVAVRPRGAAPVVLLAFTAFVLTTSSAAGWRPAAFVLLLATHLGVQLAALLGRIRWSAWVEWRALLVPAPRFLAVQLAAQLTAVAGAGLAAGRVELPWLAAAAVVALGALVLWLAPRLAAGPAAPAGSAPDV